MYDDKYLLPNGETIGHMRKDNMDWWTTKGAQSEKPEKRLQYYNKFLGNIERNVPDFDIDNYKGKIIGEACGGPFGGIIDIHYEKEEKYQIDIFADDFEALGWTKKNGSTTKWIASPCEKIDLPDNHLDVMFAFNSLDHGWDVFESIRECVRVSKHCYISFDTNRYKVPGYPDLNHYQIVDHEKVTKFLDDNYSGDNFDMKRWHWSIDVPGSDQRKHSINVLEFFIGKK